MQGVLPFRLPLNISNPLAERTPGHHILVRISVVLACRSYSVPGELIQGLKRCFRRNPRRFTSSRVRTVESTPGVGTLTTP